MGCYWKLDDVSICSSSLEELFLKDTPVDVGRLDLDVEIVTPMLKKFKLLCWADRDLVMTKFLAPMMENLSYKYFSIVSHFVGYQRRWHLESLTIAKERDNKYGQVNCGSNNIHVLSMVIIANEVCVFCLLCCTVFQVTKLYHFSHLCLYVLQILFLKDTNGPHARRSFAEEIPRLPVNNFSVLKLELKMEGRDFGSLVVHLLKILNGIQRLQLVLARNMV